MSLPASPTGSTPANALLEVEVRSRVFGASPEARGPDAVLRLLDEELTLADLIRRTVEEQVRELLVRRRLDAAGARRLLDRQYLTSEEVAEQAAHEGAVRFPSPRGAAGPAIDSDVEVRRALDAFRRGLYHVFVSGRQVERLDDLVRLGPDSRVTFLRLTPLAGG